MVYNPQGLKKVSLNKENHKRTDKSFTKMSLSKTISSSEKKYIQEYTNYPTMVLNFDSCQGEFHPTQKPIKLLEYLIKTYTNENALVLDNTMGSGSTGVACQNTNRKFIGIEMDKKYFKIAYERMKNNRGTF
jgi:site-specific DNA-methyltransferase (adenine-specific)